MIYTKVARIHSPTEIVLAAGANDGVKKGMEFIIYDLSEMIKDPETNEDLGQIELVKGRIIAEHVQDKITTAKTKSRNEERIVNPIANLAILMTGIVREAIQDQLKVEGAVAIQPDPVVRIGDRARSVV